MCSENLKRIGRAKKILEFQSDRRKTGDTFE